MNTLKSIQKITDSPMVSMGPIRLRQPLPNGDIDKVDPFILLHHYGPYAISEFNNPFDLGPHPHRGFEPITLLYKGEQLHRDSLGNEMLVKAGDVQWTTAGRGVIHSEGPTKDFVMKGGELEGIQLWLNLPADKKMMPANYQHIKSEDMPVVSNLDNSIELKVVAGKQVNELGLIKTQTEVNVFMVKTTGKGAMEINIPTSHETLIYLLDGEIIINDTVNLKKGASQMITFNQDGNRIHLNSVVESNVLILSGEPINEKIAQYGPYVMNTQTEIMEAMRDYQMGKMGYLAN
ncbi:pirin family protein [Urechidicola vernalis]|uniref:Pirin family protein n=1 Tax=Urechidicola vernalis TaxID=3075600 RepID=A0ABU2Y470_9FLAO|nr:pirin family protein [Urechidicola sp. P050]MDT0552512.1 pirin family protein [Urechidicola sp. P050]